MRTFVTILGVAFGIVLLVLLGVAVAVWTVDPNDLIGPIQARIKTATGRTVAIGGGIELKLGLAPRLVLNDVRVGNAAWAKAPEMATAKKVEAEVALLPLLQRRFELVRLNMVEPIVTLETNAEGRGNWELTVAPEGAGTPGPAAGPADFAIGDLAIERGALTYRDGATGSETQVVIDRLSLHARDAASPVSAEFRGTIDGIAVALTGNLGPLATLAERRLPYPVAVQGEIAGRKTSVAAKVHRADGAVELSDLDVTSGSTTVKGKLAVREGGRRPTWVVDLASPSLAVADLPLAPTAAPAAKRGAGAAPAAGVFTDVAVPLDALQARDAQGGVTIDRLTLPGGRRLDHVRVQFTLRDGRLDVPVLEASPFGGTATGRLTIDATRGRVPAIALAVDGRGLDLAALLALAGVAREVRGGKTNVAIDVTMHGNSPRQWMSGINGSVRAVVGPATIVNPKRDPAQPLDELARAVNPFGAVEAATELRCAVIRLPFAGGVARVERSIALETAQIDASASGTLDLRNETLDFAIRPRIRQGIPIEIPSVAELVRFRGPLSAPTVGVDAAASAATIARIGAAMGTGGLSVVGESLLRSGGPGACDVALGKAEAPAGPVGSAATRISEKPIVEDVGKALGRLFKR